MRGIRQEQLALHRPPALRLVAHDQQIDAERDDHHDEAGRRHVRRVTAAQAAECPLNDLDDHEEQEDEDPRGGERLVLAMAVRMVVVGRLPRRPHRHDAHDVRGAVSERVEAVGDDAQGAGRVAQRKFGERDGDVQREDADENAR